jgi:hypothetical protein
MLEKIQAMDENKLDCVVEIFIAEYDEWVLIDDNFPQFDTD